MKRLQRRRFLIAGTAVLALLPAGTGFAAETKKRMRIGVIGSGRIGGTLGGLWAKAGHEVMFSDRDPEQAKRAAEGAGANARVGSAKEAVAFADAVLIAVPYAALPAIAKEVGADLKGKVVIDPNNPIPKRDGDMAVAAKEKGAAVSTAGSARASVAQRGVAPIAARSERLTASALWPSARGSAPGRKCRPSTSMSLVTARSRPASGRSSAQSSPTPISARFGARSKYRRMI